MTVTATINRASKAWPPEAELARLAKRVLAATAKRAPDFPESGEVSLLFTDDAEMAALNRTWRDKPAPTNVLSFPAAPIENAGEPQAIGDIAFGFGTVSKEAAEADLTLADHISHLLVHGLLHLIGYDHGDDTEAETMESLEIAILAGLGIADPYAREPEPIGAAGSH